MQFMMVTVFEEPVYSSKKYNFNIDNRKLSSSSN